MGSGGGTSFFFAPSNSTRLRDSITCYIDVSTPHIHSGSVPQVYDPGEKNKLITIKKLLLEIKIIIIKCHHVLLTLQHLNLIKFFDLTYY